MNTSAFLWNTENRFFAPPRRSSAKRVSMSSAGRRALPRHPRSGYPPPGFHPGGAERRTLFWWKPFLYDWVVEIHFFAGAGFEPATLGLWAPRATRLLYPALSPWKPFSFADSLQFILQVFFIFVKFFFYFLKLQILWTNFWNIQHFCTWILLCFAVYLLRTAVRRTKSRRKAPPRQTNPPNPGRGKKDYVHPLICFVS